MNVNQKALLRAAVAIHQQLDPSPLSRLDLPISTWQRCQALVGRLNIAVARDWQHAVTMVRRDLEESLQQLHGEIATLAGHLAPLRERSARSTVQAIYQDLEALATEFDEVAIDLQLRKITVTTEPIVLDGIYLGPFAIELTWEDADSQHHFSYRVIAQDPHPAYANDSVTHPHVQDDSLCAGEGRHAIARALQQGRLFDFFLIVANVLRTYSPSSPYVTLADWEGRSCSDCGSTVSEEDTWVCEKCHTAICSDCYVSCACCSGIYCSGCISCCHECDESICEPCLIPCSSCRNQLCRTCLAEKERCTDCHENLEAQAESTENETTGDADPSVQPDRLGETALPA